MTVGIVKNMFFIYLHVSVREEKMYIPVKTLQLIIYNNLSQWISCSSMCHEGMHSVKCTCILRRKTIMQAVISLGEQ